MARRAYYRTVNGKRFLVRASGSGGSLGFLKHAPPKANPFQYKLGGVTLTASGGRMKTDPKYSVSARQKRLYRAHHGGKNPPPGWAGLP